MSALLLDSNRTSLIDGLDRFVQGGLLILCAVHVAAILVLSGAEPFPNWLRNAGWTVAALFAALRCALTARARPERHLRTAWYLLALAAFTWFLGMVALWIDEVFDLAPTRPSPANFLFVALAPLFASGLFFLRFGGRETADTVRRLANLAIVFCAAVIGSLVVYLEPLRQLDAPWALLIFSIADPVAFATATLFALSLLWMRGSEALRGVYLLLLASVALHTIGNFLYFQSVTRFPEVSTWRLDVLWIAALSLHYRAALVQHRVPPDVGQQWGGADRSRYSPAEALLPTALILGLVVLWLLHQDHTTPQLLAIVVPLLVLLALLIGFREWWAARHEEQLLKHLTDSERHSRRLVSASPAIIFELRQSSDGLHLIASGNAQTIFPAPLERYEDLVGQAHPVDRRALRRQIALVRERGASSLQYRVPQADGESLWVDQRMVLYGADASKPWEIFGSIMDVSHAKRLETRVMNNQRLESLGRLAGGIAHDFNNLLTSILGFTELARDAMPADDPGRELLAQSQVASEKAAALTRQLLAFSRRQPLELTVVDVNRTIEQMMDMLGHMIGEGIRLEFSPAATAVKVRGDEGQLEQVIMNLVINAADAIRAEGLIRITVDEVLIEGGLLPEFAAKPADTCAMICVDDDGCGMSAAVQSRIFDPFFSTKSDGKGTGLGLATVHGIVRQHNGVIEVKSSEGAGASFCILLPATTEPASEPAREHRTRIPEGNETIFVVDDDAPIPELVRRVLEPAGYEVLTATSMAEALAVSKDCIHRIDLLLTDVILPKGNGHELARAMKAMKPDLLVVYMSGYVDDVRLRGEIAGSGGPFIEKPLALGAMANLLRSLLDGRASPASQRD